jgi:hypothetical protein
MYCNDQFVELESLGPLTKLNPGAEIKHIEKWDVIEGLASLPGEIKYALQNHTN